MRQALSFILAISCAGYILAQDIIILNTGEHIENVKVLNVIDSTITYNQQNSTQSIRKSDVMAVMYSDGRYEEIRHSKVIENYDKYLFPVKAFKEFVYKGHTIMIIAGGTQFNQTLQQIEKYYLCIEVEDHDAYYSFRRKNKHTFRQFEKSVKQTSKELRFYDVAFQASTAYKQKKAEGASSDEAWATLVNTFIFIVNNH